MVGLWQMYALAIEEIERRAARTSCAMHDYSVDYAFAGGIAVALWVSTKDPAATRTTKNVDLLIRREDLPRARAAAASIDMDYFEVMGVGMFLERADPNPRKGVHLLWAGQKVRPEDPLPCPGIDERIMLQPGQYVVALEGLVRMKLISFRDQDRVHLRDMIEVGLIERDLLQSLPQELASRLDSLLTEAGR